jgi:chromosome segregation ATPase
MARTGVSYDEVEKAATALHQQGLNPTVQRIREALGTGSNTTIARHLKTWHDAYFAEEYSRVPMAIPEEIAASVDGFWAAAVAKADANYQYYREALAQERDVANAEKEAALLRLDQVQQHNEQLQTALADRQRVIDEQQRQLQRLQGQYDELTAHHDTTLRDAKNLHALAQAAIEHAEAAKRTWALQVADQKHQYEQRMEQLNHALQEEKTRCEAQENRHWGKVDKLQQALEHADQRTMELENALAVQQQQLESEQHHSAQQIRHLESQHEQTKDALQRAQDEKATLQKELANVTARYQADLSEDGTIVRLLTQSLKAHDAIFEKMGNLETTVATALRQPSKMDKDKSP